MTYQEQYQSSLNEINAAMQKCLKEKPPCTGTVQGKKRKVKSNDKLQKIKSLGHDEMAKFLKDNFDMSCEIMCPYVDEHGNCTDFSDSFDCIDALKDWLKAESEED